MGSSAIFLVASHAGGEAKTMEVEVVLRLMLSLEMRMC